jgi:hypothetical protein
LGPQISPHGGKIIPADVCLAACGADGSGSSTCNAHDMGIPHSKTWGPSFSYTWGATAVLPGRFGNPAPAPINGSASNYPYHWVTVGGADTSSSDWADTAEQDILNTGARGLAFDEEGGVVSSEAKAWILKMRKKHPSWTFV